MKVVQKIIGKIFSHVSSKPTDKPTDSMSSTTPDNSYHSQQQSPPTQPAGTLQIALQNRTTSSDVYAYITGRAINSNNAPIFVGADGYSLYYPKSPSSILSPLEADVAIPLGAPGDTVNAYIPHIAGGRIWFSIGAKLTFLLNPGPAVVEPSVTNPTDANINISWCFCEFTYNSAQLFANISYVDFVSIPVALNLLSTSGQIHRVPGMGHDGFANIVSRLRAQAACDGRPWDQLIYSFNGSPLRVLSPNHFLVGKPNAFGDYWDKYIQDVWGKFTNEDMTINTQAAAGDITGRVTGDTLNLGQAGSFSKPSANDIFSCSTGPFQTGANAARNAVIPRLAAAFNRSTLLNCSCNTFPNGSNTSHYYSDGPTNHYSRIVHDHQAEGRGYAFPYDDVVPDGGNDVAGTLFDGSPKLFTVAVGGH